MSEIRQVGPNHWVGPEDFGFTPNFHITQHGVEHYPNGHLIQQEPLNPGNKKIPIVHRRKDAEDMGEFFDGFSAGGHEDFLDMRVRSVHSSVAVLTDAGQQALTVGEYRTDEYGNEWRTASLQTEITVPVLDSQEPLWEYAEQLDTVYCSTCHSKIPASHFTVNAWGPVAKGMGDRTDISDYDLEVLTKFFQNHAKDVAGH